MHATQPHARYVYTLEGNAMKKWILMASVMLAAGSFTACGDDPKEEQPPTGDVTDDDTTDTDGTTNPDTCYVADSAKPGFGTEVNLADGGGDADADGVCDSLEGGLSNTDGVACNTLADCDGDGISDAGEFFYRDDRFDGTGYATSPNNANTDGAGGNDLDEANAGLDPTTAADNVDDSDNTEIFTGNAYSYVSGIAIAGTDCCFTNLDADPQIDNDLAQLLNDIAPLLGQFLPDPEPDEDPLDLSPEGIGDLIAPLLEDGTLTLIFEETNVPTDIEGGTSTSVKVQPYFGSLAGDTIASLAVRQAGDGEYFLGDAVGAQFDAIINKGQFIVTSGDLALNLDLTDLVADLLGEPLVLDLSVSKLRVRGAISEQTKTGSTDTIGIATDERLEVGGGVGIGQLVTVINDLLGSCYEPGFELLSLDTTSNPDRVALACAENIPAVSNPDGLGELCGEVGGLLGTICPLLDNVLGSKLSVDTDDDGKADGLAVGIKLEMSGAADIREPVAPVAAD